MKRLYFSLSICFSLILFCCATCEKSSIGLYEAIPEPKDNPLTKEKIELGRALFFDKQLSKDESISCASCHVPSYAFTDRRKVSRGVDGRITERNSPTLLNAAYLKTAMFDAHLASLELQVIVPIQEHVEMDMSMGQLIDRLKKVDYYSTAAKKIFNRSFDAYVLTRSIAAFERTLISQNAPFDRYFREHKKNAISQDALKGWKLFSGRLNCVHCHPPPFFTHFKAENNGVYSAGETDKGRFRIFNDSSDIGKFKVPTLRNIELTYPYMHDGRFETLNDVIDHYQKGGSNNTLKHPIIQSFQLTKEERFQLMSFFKSLTDTSYMNGFKVF
jgi:cytochrome c peroxidase